MESDFNNIESENSIDNENNVNFVFYHEPSEEEINRILNSPEVSDSPMADEDTAGGGVDTKTQTAAGSKSDTVTSTSMESGSTTETNTVAESEPATSSQTAAEDGLFTENGPIPVNFKVDTSDFDNTEEEKRWMFMENVRLVHERQEIDVEKERLEREKRDFMRLRRRKENELATKEKHLARQKDLFDKQWGVVEKELHRIAKDRDRISKERAYIEREKEILRIEQSKSSNYTVSNGAFFVGVNSEASLKRRYRELIKIYHPDSGNGDEATLLYINKEYENVKRRFGLS